MRSSRVCLAVFVFVVLLSFYSGSLFAQTASTGAVTGTVTDPSGATVAGASVTLSNPATATQLSTPTDSGGHYIFPSVLPGQYALKVTTKGFRTFLISAITVDVTKSSTVDVKLELGESTQTIEVISGIGTELQTTDASVGGVLSGLQLNQLPAIARSSASLVLQMPGVAPDTGGGDTTGGQIAGARSEQVTFTIDGGDATSDLEGSNNYVSPNNEPSAISPVVPIPIEATEEFRVATNNPNATFGNSSGGQVALLTKSGTNNFHGTAYEYHGDNGLNSNSWNNDRLGLNKPHAVDNRFGGQVGGPILKDKLFFWGFYEGRRFYDSSQVSRVVPSATLKQGILQFKDANGNVDQYNLNPANGPLTTACNGGACDPLGLGVSPVVMSQLALYPTGNDATLGDGLNTIGLTANVATPVLTNTGKVKFNYNINSKWNAFVTFQTSKTVRTGTEQIDILGTPKPASTDPYYSNFYTFQVQGTLTPNLTSVTHGSFLRNWWAWGRTAPTTFVSGTDAPLQIAGEGVGNSNSLSKLIADPVNINTQQARSRVWDGHDWYVAQDFTWVHGSHAFQFGGTGRIWNDYHLRTDDVLGGLTTAPIYYIGSRGQSNNAYVQIGSAYEPPTCDTGVTINCLSTSSDVTRWNGLYSALLGLVDHSTQIQTRDGNFNPNPLGTPLYDKVKIPAFTTYFQDVWKARPSLTITYGLNWGSQLPPSEATGKEVVLTYADSNAPVDYQQFLQARVNSLGQGQLYNPSFGLVPVNHLSGALRGKMRVNDWTDLSPRVSVAWQVPFQNAIFGNHQTVIRGGYGKVYDRSSAVNQVLSPLLTGGLADVDQCQGPLNIASGGGCSGARTNPASAYRIGVDGTGPGVPAPSAKPIPFIPAAPFGLFLSAPLDPYATPGYAHTIDLTIQRAFSNGFFVEVGYIGRFSRNLPQGQSLTSPYYLMKDPGGSGQTYAQAFDSLATALRTGGTITPQPFFENVIGTSNCIAQGFPNCTAMEGAFDPGDLINGDLNSFGTFELNFDAPQALDNMQIFEFSGITDKGYSNYNAGFLSVRRQMARGLSFNFDWTWSHAIGNGGTNQQYLVSSNSPYNINLDRGSEVFDHRHVMHAFAFYDLPFGKGQRFASGNNVLDRVIGGWSASGIWSYYSGAPACVLADGDYGSFFNETCAVPVNGKFGSRGTHMVSGDVNFFADPTSTFGNLTYPLMSQFSRIPYGSYSALPYWQVDLSVRKNIASTEKLKVILQGDAFNILNHPIFATPSLDLGDPTNFGVINGTQNAARILQLGLRVEF